MLKRAAAADAEMRADRIDPVGTSRQHVHKRCVLAVGVHLDADPFARQRKGHKERTVGGFGDAIALGAEPVDLNFNGHGMPR